jgi:hypothetical protein
MKKNPFYYYLFSILPIVCTLMFIHKNYDGMTALGSVFEAFRIGLFIVMSLTFFHLRWIEKNWTFYIFVLLLLIIDIVFLANSGR